ncbi:unnamed protein product [Spirodela intermedia]|uniref:Uncharacterized protein n=1 Tax=Spirodela intermedia TaxID=51605 RepID=A0A7I8JLI0_SPIIN|nr:unnamed protein product [Spirodela intermedia]CAA6670665.1 unnamed protein product [Spirodela intermedia]
MSSASSSHRSSPGRLPFVRQCDQEALSSSSLLRSRPKAGVNLVADLVGVTLGPKGRNVVLQNKYGPPKIVNDGETVLKEAGAKTNDLAGDGSTTSVVLAQGLIAEGVKVQAMKYYPRELNRVPFSSTSTRMFFPLSQLDCSKESVDSQYEIADVAAVSAGNDYSVGNMIAEALQRVGRKGVVRIEKGMQFDRGYLSPYFVTDRANRTAEFENCKVLLVDKKITAAKEMFKILDGAVKEKYPLLIVGESVEQEVLAPIIRNKLRGLLKVAVIKAPAFGERKSHYLDDIAILTGETFKKKILSERIARLSSAPTEVELKSKMLRVEDALNATKAAIEEGVVVGGGCSLLRLSLKVDDIKNSLDNEEQKVPLFYLALSYPTKLIAKNAGVNGSVVIQKILSSNDSRYGYNAAKDCYEDLMDAGILDPSKVVRCCVEHAASVARTFLTSDVVVVDTREPYPATMRPRMPTSGPMPSFGHTPTFSPLPSKVSPKSTPFSPLGSKRTPGQIRGHLCERFHSSHSCC